ncbi:MAG: hypothetical protein A2511_16025 [Deltaproteobacteria bacterium RIFOXYD12_FULL_50_9]|nr:MAG: hypothetical protein A2511_16025 [Deltaproteobacteria bacterium RIFOXYD12_FULL_50_9]
MFGLKKRIFTAFFVLVAGLTLSGCGTVGNALNPYKEDFRCKTSDEAGNCVDTKTAYDDAKGLISLGNNKGKGKENNDCAGGDCGKAGQTERKNNWDKKQTSLSQGEAAYQDAQYQKLADMLEKPQTPIMKPPKLMRVLMLSYQVPDELYMPRHIYLKVEEAKWIFGSDIQVRQEDR